MEDSYQDKYCNICIDCPKIVNIEKNVCSVYNIEGMAYRNRMGYCPVSDKYADWREDQPKAEVKKVLIGQQKQKKKK